MKQNYLLIDFENVQPRNLALLGGRPFKIFVFLGANQPTIPVELASELQRFGSNVQYVQVSGTGKNALDFHIAFKLGELLQVDRAAAYHIVSKDKGYDALIQHLKAQRLNVHRFETIADISPCRVPNGQGIDEKSSKIVDNLRKRVSGRPQTVSKLKNTINGLFSNSLPDAELARITNELAKRRHIKIDGENVSYHFPDTPNISPKTPELVPA